MVKQPSRQTRWDAAVALLQEARDEFETLIGEYQDWLDGLPEGGSEATREKLETVTQVDLDGLELGDLESMDLPLGFGRD